MVAWWQQAHAALIGQSITREGNWIVFHWFLMFIRGSYFHSIDIALMVKQTYVEMRPNTDIFLKKCADMDIPLLVFSAGVVDVIQEALNQHNMFHDNMHIVSNKMGWNADGICDHFEDPLIHVFNKSEFSLEKTDYYKTIKERKNVILLGDSVGDVLMSQGVQHDTCLNIGFLNHDVETLYPKYSQLYDIVIVDDSSIDPVVSILEKLQ